MNNKPETPSGTPGDVSTRDRRRERRKNRRKAALVYAMRLVAVAVIPAAIPSLRSDLPEPAPAPAAPHSMEQPPYDNTPAEPFEGLSNLAIRSNR